MKSIVRVLICSVLQIGTMILLLLGSTSIASLIFEYKKNVQLGITWEAYIISFSVMTVLLNVLFSLKYFKNQYKIKLFFSFLSLLILVIIFWSAQIYHPLRMTLIHFCALISLTMPGIIGQTNPSSSE
jgi:hypothetical protein